MNMPLAPEEIEAAVFLAKFDINKALTDYEQLDAERRRLTQAADRCATTQAKIEGYIRKYLDLTKQDAAKVGKLTATKKDNPLPSAENWDEFYAWIKENNAFEFLERRIKKTAVEEYLAAHEGKPPPGVKIFNRPDVSITGLNKGKREGGHGE